MATAARHREGGRAPTLSNLQPGAAGAAAAYATALVSIRRVVTGHDASGKSVFASDELLEPETVAMFPGWAFVPVWGRDETPTYPDDGREPPWTSYFPPLGGIRFSFTIIPPEDQPGPPEDL